MIHEKLNIWHEIVPLPPVQETLNIPTRFTWLAIRTVSDFTVKLSMMVDETAKIIA